MAEKKTKTSQIISTGRRKKSIARVRLFPGSGKWTVNGREMGVPSKRYPSFNCS